MEAIPLDDGPPTRCSRGGTRSASSSSSPRACSEALRKIRPTEFNDIVAIGALYRPGAMRFIPDYARGKRNPDSVTYQDPRLRPITQETYGCCVYQEQLMEISKQIGGFTGTRSMNISCASSARVPASIWQPLWAQVRCGPT